MNDSRHIDIYDNSEVQPPSYLNVKDAPDDSEDHLSEAEDSKYRSNNVRNNMENYAYLSDSNAMCKKPKILDQEYRTKKDGKNARDKNKCTAGGEGFGYNLTRSKSVCDLSAVNNAQLLSTENPFTVQHKKILEKSSVTNMSLASLSTTYSGVSSSHYGAAGNKTNNTSVNTEKRSVNQQKVSRIVRNRTILGSFPLFYKLSQSLSSLNSGGGVSAESAITSKPILPNHEKYSKIRKELGDISSLSYPISTTTTPIPQGGTLGVGLTSFHPQIITEYDGGCFYVEDTTRKDR